MSPCYADERARARHAALHHLHQEARGRVHLPGPRRHRRTRDAAAIQAHRSDQANIYATLASLHALHAGDLAQRPCLVERA